MKREVLSWRLSSEDKSVLEREARRRKMPVSSLLDMAVREWLAGARIELDEEEEQRQLHAAASEFVGVLEGASTHHAERARATVRDRLKRLYGR